jgi:hypothetical protein
MENAMRRILPPLSAALAACAPPPQEALVPGPGTTADRRAPAQLTAAQAPVPKPVSAATNTHPGPLIDSDAEAHGRRIVSTAFVRISPDGQLFVELRDARVLVLRDVTMGATEFCGMQAADDVQGTTGKRQCHGYAEVVAARSGDTPAGGTPVPAGSKSVATERSPGRER